MDSPKPVRTHELDLAAFLIAQGASLVDIDRSDAARQVFVLSGTHLPEDVTEYVGGTATVNVERFRDARRLLLDRLHRSSRVG